MQVQSSTASIDFRGVSVTDTRYVPSQYAYILRQAPEVAKEHDLKKREQLQRIKDYIIYIETLIDRFDKFSVSYNQVLLRGTLRYCSNALKKLMSLRTPNAQIYYEIKSFVNLSKGLLEVCHKNHLTERSLQDEYPTISLADLELQLLEDRFEIIEKACKQKGVLPLLDDLIVEEDENE